MKLKRKVGEKGQVVIPKEIRDREGIDPDSEVYFWIDDGKIVVEKEESRLSETLDEVSREAGGVEREEREQVRKRMERAGIDV